jgi:hypothetical protein
MGVAISPLTTQMRRRQGAYRYMNCTMMHRLGPNLLPVSAPSNDTIIQNVYFRFTINIHFFLTLPVLTTLFCGFTCKAAGPRHRSCFGFHLVN